MRKADIKPGVVYAYQRSRVNGSPSPVIVLSLDLYDKRGKYKEKAEPQFGRATPGTLPGDGFGGEATGYPVVRVAGRWRQNRPDLSELAKRMAVLTLADFEASRTRAVDDDIEFDVLPRFQSVVSTWEEARKRQAAEQVRLAKAHAERDELDERAGAAIAALGVDAEWDSMYERVTLSLDEAEKLARLLNRGTGE